MTYYFQGKYDTINGWLLVGSHAGTEENRTFVKCRKEKQSRFSVLGINYIQNSTFSENIFQELR